VPAGGYFGIQTTATASSSILNNFISAGGIKITSTGYNLITGNSVTNATTRGIFCSGAGKQKVSDNTVAGSASTGIYITASTDAIVTGNKVATSTADGIFLDDLTKGLVSDNIVTGTASSYYDLKWDFAGSVSSLKATNNYFDGRGVLFTNSFAGTHDVELIGNNILNAAVNGITITGTTATPRILITDNYIYNAATTGILFPSSLTSYSIVADNIIDTGGTNGGILTGSASNIVIKDNLIENISGDGIYSTGTGTIIDGNDVRVTGTSGAEAGIACQNTGAVITNNRITGTSAMNYGIRAVSNACDGALITGNQISGATVNDIIFPTGADSNKVYENSFTTISDSGASNAYARNIGYATENEGVTGAIASGANVAHGLSGTPDYVIVTPGDTGVTDFYATPVDGTNFTITYSGGGAHIFYWRAVFVP
jgi:parallel beta-helix repeat protein